jgi:hypothetical protein
MMTAYYWFLGQVYGGGPYSTATYEQTSGSGGGLSNTGIAIASIVTLAALILLATLVIRIWKRPSRQLAQATEPAEMTTSEHEER